MNVSFNRDHLTLKFSVNPETYEEDLLMGLRLERLMESEDFQVLIGEWMKAEELYKEAVLKVGMTDADSRITGKKAAAFNGFNEATKLIQKFVDSCNRFRKEEINRVNEELKIQSGTDVTLPNYD